MENNRNPIALYAYYLFMVKSLNNSLRFCIHRLVEADRQQGQIQQPAKMKKSIMILLTILTLQSTAQTFDSLYYTLRGVKVNLKDEQGRKQGEWLFYELKDCKEGPLYLGVETYITAIGYYTDDKKTGTWEYFIPNHDPCSEHTGPTVFLKKVQYTGDSVLITGYNTGKMMQDKSYELIANHDSTRISAKVYDPDERVLGVCFKDISSDTTLCRLLGGTKRNFVRKQYVFGTIDEVFRFVECGYRCWN